MFIDVKMKDAQHGMKGQHALMPAGLKIHITLPRNCNDEHLISQADELSTLMSVMWSMKLIVMKKMKLIIMPSRARS